MKRIFYLSVAILFMTMSITEIKAQQTVTQAKYYAISLYNFSKHVKWPDELEKGDFEIAVVGDQGVYNELKKMTSSLKLGSRSYKISYYRKYTEVKSHHHILYLSSSQSGKIKAIKSNTHIKNVLYVTEREGMGSLGSAISFFVNDSGRIEFELIKENFDGNNLLVSRKLLALASER